ncbi:MAG: DUF1579 family protein [Acidobacteriota bacterium]
MALTLSLISPLLGQPKAMEKGKAHAKLDALVGTWIAEDPAPTPEGQAEIRGRSRYAWTVGDVWLREELVGQVPGIGTVHGATLITHDPTTGNYTGFWMDNLTPRTYPFRAYWASEEEFVFESSFDEPFHLTIRFRFRGRDVIDVVHLRRTGEGPAEEWRRLTLRRHSGSEGTG